jgi:hypothetical protein
MKRILLALLCLGQIYIVNGQDAIFSEDFQGFLGGEQPFEFIPEVDDAVATDWVNLDLDNLPANASGAGDWYVTTDFNHENVEVVGDSNIVMASQSWLVGFAPDNTNLLITPEIEVPGSGYVLRWTSGVFQTPRYADGYRVLISPDADIAAELESFTDEVFVQAQMVEDIGWNADFYGDIDYSACATDGGLDASTFCWFPEVYGDGTGGTGYRHAEDHTNPLYLFDEVGSTTYTGLMEPHSADLSAYAGQTIRVGFLHDSDDDNLTSLDDVVVELFTSVDEYSFDELVNFYPNPATEALTLNFSNIVKESAQVSVYDNTGRLVISETYSGYQLRAFNNLNIAGLASGMYSLQINIDEKGLVGKSFVKR